MRQTIMAILAFGLLATSGEAFAQSEEEASEVETSIVERPPRLFQRRTNSSSRFPPRPMGKIGIS